ncbi:carbohydrate ABC transporter permease [Occultella aeris]|uniref:Trehalose transport system permease protein SugA n=1 Tax=Occultella aeris TaxID=2761496 RepID=A0A7M4DP33_9MICO|nr:sugar ABC transporter permease [Occultella aeris]VZO39219.1 Trehalose transport system permease protein SugA [Occultella aeris]
MSTDSVAQSLRRARSGVGVAGAGRPPDARPKRVLSPRNVTMIALVLPSILLVLLLNAYPVLYAGVQSVRDGDLISSGDFVGLANYQTVLSDPVFWQAARFTLVFTLVGVFGSWAMGMGLALLLRRRIPAGGLFKVLLLLPWVVPVVVSATSWNWLVATPQSPLPILADALGFGRVLFLANPLLAQITVCVFKVWISFPFMMMMMGAALAAVDNNVYEAARVDGASGAQLLRTMTLPLTAKSTFISWILMTIFCVNDFPTVFLLTGGGPVNATQTLVVQAYRTVFLDFETGPGVAIAFLMTVVLVVISVVLYRSVKKVDIE